MKLYRYASKRPMMIGAGHTDGFINQETLQQPIANGRSYILTYNKAVPFKVVKELELLSLCDNADTDMIVNDIITMIDNTPELAMAKKYAHSGRASEREKAFTFIDKNLFPTFCKEWHLHFDNVQMAYIRTLFKQKLEID